MNAIDTTTLSRRAFLATSGALVVALMTPAELAAAASPSNGVASRPPVTPDKLSSYITIEPDGTVIGYYGKIDGGQGLETSISQLVAEEIDVPWDRVCLVMGDTGRVVDMGGATAGDGLRRGGSIMRQTAAEARRVLVEMGSKALGVPVSDLTVTDGVVHSVADPSKKISYAELVGGRYLDTAVDWKDGPHGMESVKVPAQLKKPSEFKVIGKPMPRRDMPGKVFGTLEQCADVRLPNMVHARMIRPTVAGAVPMSVDEKSVANIPGVQVVWIKNVLAVVAEKEWNAVRAAKALKVTWSHSEPKFPGNDKLHDYIRKAAVVASSQSGANVGGGIGAKTIGNVAEGFKKAARVIEAEYEYPLLSHASMGPACAVADVKDGGATIWTSTQKPWDSANCVAELLDLPKDKVRAIWMFGTGGYARDAQGDATADAALLSNHLKRPVRVQYMRHESIAWDPKGTATVNRYRAGFDADGNLVAYDNVSKGFSGNDCNIRETHPSDVLAGQLNGAPVNFQVELGVPGNAYQFENASWSWEVIAPLMDRASPLRTTHLRDPFGPPLMFGSESFIDELAVAANSDPMEFRLKYLKDRERDLFNAAAKQYGWDTRPSPRNDQANAAIAVGRGFAYRQLAGTYIALIAEVKVHRDTGLIEVPRIVCAHDCGLIVNSETIKHVVDRQLHWQLGRTLIEELKFDENMVTSVDWLTYPVLKMGQAPRSVEVVTINRPDTETSGAAEMACGPLPAAIGNAVFDATGVRLRRMPFTQERMKAALDQTTSTLNVKKAEI